MIWVESAAVVTAMKPNLTRKSRAGVLCVFHTAQETCASKSRRVEGMRMRAGRGLVLDPRP